jgi:hypothetical protein
MESILLQEMKIRWTGSARDFPCNRDKSFGCLPGSAQAADRGSSQATGGENFQAAGRGSVTRLRPGSGMAGFVPEASLLSIPASLLSIPVRLVSRLTGTTPVGLPPVAALLSIPVSLLSRP